MTRHPLPLADAPLADLLAELAVAGGDPTPTAERVAEITREILERFRVLELDAARVDLLAALLEVHDPALFAGPAAAKPGTATVYALKGVGDPLDVGSETFRGVIDEACRHRLGQRWGAERLDVAQERVRTRDKYRSDPRFRAGTERLWDGDVRFLKLARHVTAQPPKEGAE